MAPQINAQIRNVIIDVSKSFATIQVNNRSTKLFLLKTGDFTFGNIVLRIIKPARYFEQRHRQQRAKKQVQGHKIFMGGIPRYIQQPTVKQICLTFGELKHFKLITQNGESKGYCFFEYVDPKNSQNAIKSLNNMPIADRRLRVQKAQNQFKPQGHQISTKPSNYAGSFLLSYQNYHDADVQLTIRIPSYSQIPSRVLQLLNMCYPQDLFQQSFYYDLINDVRDQTQRYGVLEQIVIPRPDPISGYAPPSIGKVFVKFMYLTPARRARKAISGKVYNKRTCIASFYPEERFDLRQYLISY